jgi:DNA-binding response OmpR family regulator
MGTVLVVDDDRNVCALLCDAFEDQGLEADCCATDAEAYQRLARPPLPDALVVDINLRAGTTGFDVARFARRQNEHIVVVFVSGAVTPESHEAHGVPGSEFFEKPIVLGDVAATVTARLAAAR